MKQFILLAVPLLLFFNELKSQQNQLIIGAEIRPKFIVDNGYKTPLIKNEDAILYTCQRTRINATFSNNKYECFISFQDVRLWGDDDHYKTSGQYGNSSSSRLHQGWVMLNLNSDFSIKTGRQIFSYDDQRIISARNWNDYQVGYDAVLMQYTKKSNKLDIAVNWNADNKNDNYYSSVKFRLFDFIRYETRITNFKFSTIAVLSGNTLRDTTSSIYLRGTYGINGKYMSDNINSRASLYYQHNMNTIGPKTSAYCFSAFAEKALFNRKLFLGIGLDYISGNDESKTQNTNHQFDLLYGRRHGWYGYMDYFSTTPEQGLQDYMLKARFNIQKDLNLHIDFHHFLLAENILNSSNPNKTMDRKLGQEIDLKIKWEFLPEASLECGYSAYFVSNTLKQLKEIQGQSIKFPQFAFIMLTIKSVFNFY